VPHGSRASIVPLVAALFSRFACPAKIASSAT
jgi:hypothetical protein